MERIGRKSFKNKCGSFKTFTYICIAKSNSQQEKESPCIQVPSFVPSSDMTSFKCCKSLPFNMYLNREKTPPTEYSSASRQQNYGKQQAILDVKYFSVNKNRSYKIQAYPVFYTVMPVSSFLCGRKTFLNRTTQEPVPISVDVLFLTDRQKATDRKKSLRVQGEEQPLITVNSSSRNTS